MPNSHWIFFYRQFVLVLNVELHDPILRHPKKGTEYVLIRTAGEPAIEICTWDKERLSKPLWHSCSLNVSKEVVLDKLPQIVKVLGESGALELIQSGFDPVVAKRLLASS